MQSKPKQFIPENNTELIAKEYEDFAYIVSHDLNAPLRHVREFTRLLIGGRKDNLSEEEQEYVEYLEKSLQKLDDMQRALLTFSRLNTRAGELRAVDCNRAVADALHELEEDVKKYAPVVEYKKLPTIVAEPKQIQMLFAHLIDNSLKFHDGVDDRNISISAIDQGDTWLFELKDNGIGLPEQYHDEVFRLFRRLQPDKYSGIGIGLTIAHKIVQRHGGQMLIESEPGEGMSVFFSLPRDSRQ